MYTNTKFTRIHCNNMVFLVIIFSTFFVFGELLVQTTIAEEPLEEASAHILGRHIDWLMNETLGVEKMQKRINVLNFTRKRFNGTALVKELADIISKKINQHIASLNRTKMMLQEEVNSQRYKPSEKSPWASCCHYDESKTAYDKGFKTKIDDSSMCELVSETTPLKYYSVPRTVFKLMQENRRKIPSMKWQYIGSDQGVFFGYPAHRRPSLCTGTHYDPRYRPWFVETASPDEKHVIIVLDSSNSMARTHNSKRLIDVAKDAVISVLETLTPKDKIALVVFNDTAHLPSNCFSKQLAFADKWNIRTLKESFLNRLEPRGQSKYVEAFRAAFDLFVSSWTNGEKIRKYRPEMNKKFNCVILFISDGDATEIHRNKVNDIYRAIREGNRNITNVVKIFTYGLGRNINLTLLEKIAKQDFDAELGTDTVTEAYGQRLQNISQGIAYRIEEPFQLRNKISFFYENLITDDQEDKPSFSVPYVDQGGLGLVFTAGFGVYGRIKGRKFLVGVAAVDISISDLLEDVIKLKNDDRSYVFVIDGSGRVLLHPLMPTPEDVADAPSFIRIEAMERDPELKDVIKSMMAGKSGQKTLLSNRVAPAGDCNTVFIVNQTYHWHPIANTNFSLCFVEEKTDYEVILPPEESVIGCKDEQGKPLHINQCENITKAKFRYHRLDLSESTNVCRHFYQISTVESSVVKLAPQCFQDTSSYEQTFETKSTVGSYERLFNSLYVAESTERVLAALHSGGAWCDVIRDDAISDVVWTAYADSLWLGKSESNSHVVRRYIGTRTGTVRLYPGTNLSSSYDPIKRDWYELALAFPGLRTFSPPYKDAAGAGNVITISHTVSTPKLEESHENEETTEAKVIAVMGLDLSLNSFYAQLLELYPKCDKEWSCLLLDIRGYLVLHKDYTKSDAPERKHIVGEEGQLSRILLDSGLMFRARCLELESTKYKVSYVLVNNAFLNTMSHSDVCKRYYLEAIPNSNLFFVAMEKHDTCYRFECRKNGKACYQHLECLSHDNWSTKTCECPCRTDLIIDSCNSYVDARIDIIPCYPLRKQGEVAESDCIPTYLPSCDNPRCDKQTIHINCSSIVGCTWCQNSETGAILKEPYCADTDQCYNGYEKQKLPGFSAKWKACAIGKDEDNTVILIASLCCAVFLLLFIAVTFACCCIRKKGTGKEKDSSNNQSAEYNAVATIAAALGAHEQGRKSSGVSAIPALSNNNSSHNSGGSSGGRHSSTSSKPSNDRQRVPSSPQVVLSIVDSDGAEIARSLPRPVQIVRGNQGPSSPSNIVSRSTASTSDTDRQIRSNSTASIVLGSAAGESSGFVSSNNSSSVTSSYYPFTGYSRQSKKKSGGNGSTIGSAEVVIRKRILSADRDAVIFGNDHTMENKYKSAPSSVIDDGNNDMGEEKRNRSFSEERGVKKERKSRRTKMIAYNLLSFMRGKSQISPSSESDKVKENTAPVITRNSAPLYSDMFAEPSIQEGDIPIIQSDHSDSEMDYPQSNRATSDYVSVCESGRLSVCSWLTTPRQRRGIWGSFVNGNELEDQDDAVPDADPKDVFYDNDNNEDNSFSFSVPDLSVDFPISDYFKLPLPGHSSLDCAVVDPESNEKLLDTSSAIYKNNFQAEESKPTATKRKVSKKRAGTRERRSDDINTNNFIVYV